jgi:hypothetical protein
MQHQVRTRWGAFAGGVSVGLITGLAGVGVAVALERARRRNGGSWRQDPASTRPQQARAVQEAHLDEELAQTFPASDPLPSSHLVD